MVEALYIAAKQDKEQAIATYLQAQLQADTLSLTAYCSAANPSPDSLISLFPLFEDLYKVRFV